VALPWDIATLVNRLRKVEHSFITTRWLTRIVESSFVISTLSSFLRDITNNLERTVKLSYVALFCVWSGIVGRDSSVGIATGYVLDGPGIESRWGRGGFPDRPLGSPILLYNGYQVFLGSKAAEPWRWPTTPSSAEVKKRVQLYIYPPSRPSWPVLGWTLPLPLPVGVENHWTDVWGHMPCSVRTENS
jgi:hypothetical protein